MPRIDAGGVELFYESVGEGIPFILQAHHHLSWMSYQASYFSEHYRFITFDRRGIVLRDLDSGLIDFPSVRDGREIYLCWIDGEDDIEFWHDLDAGFAGRQPL